MADHNISHKGNEVIGEKNEKKYQRYSMPSGSSPMQIIKYRWENFQPMLIVNNGSIGKMRLFDTDINFSVGKKRCIGSYVKGVYQPCPKGAEINYGYYCNECRLNDDFFLCVQCDGSECINNKRRSDCEEEQYFIYLAAFDSLLKVGISLDHRIMERLIEQGADFGAKVAVVKDGKMVRIIEQQIKKDLGIADRILGEEKYHRLFCDPNKAAASLYKAIVRLRSNGLSEYLIYPEIFDMRKYYKLQNVAIKPRHTEIQETVKLSGKVVAAKGNILVLQNDSEFFAVNAHRLIGREIEI